jgi:hypothetical protein
MDTEVARIQRLFFEMGTSGKRIFKGWLSEEFISFILYTEHVPVFVPYTSETACTYSIPRPVFHIARISSPRATELLTLALCLGNESLKSTKK